MKCEIIHDIFFRDSEDPLPLTMPGTYYIDCEVEESLEDGVKYALHAMYQVCFLKILTTTPSERTLDSI